MTLPKCKPEAPPPRYARKPAAARRQQLIEAAIRCLGAGGMSAFTIDRICQEAQVSRGLINHHFDGKDDLLICVYDAMTAYLAEVPFAGLTRPGLPPAQRLAAAIDASFDPSTFDPTQLRAWLSLWGEVPGHQRLRDLHRARYEAYREGLTEAIAGIAEERGRPVDAARLAGILVALIDGLWLESCLDSSAPSLASARQACYALVEPHLGKIRP